MKVQSSKNNTAGIGEQPNKSHQGNLAKEGSAKGSGKRPILIHRPIRA